MKNEIIVNVNGQEIKVVRIDNDVNGNPRYLVHFLSLGLKEYRSSVLTKKAGLKIYRSKKVGGCFVFQSYDVKSDLEYMLGVLTGN